MRQTKIKTTVSLSPSKQLLFGKEGSARSMTDGKTTYGFSMNTMHPLDRDFLFTDTVT